MLSWKPCMLVWFTCVLLGLQHSSSHIKEVFFLLLIHWGGAVKYFINLQFVKHVGNSPTVQSWKTEKRLNVEVHPSKKKTRFFRLLCVMKLLSTVRPNHQNQNSSSFCSSALPLLPTGHVRPPPCHPPDWALRLAAGRLSAQGKTCRDNTTHTHSHSHAHTHTHRQLNCE